MLKIFFRLVLAVVVLVPLTFVGLMFFKGMKSKDESLARVGLEEGRLKACDPAPNCVCSVGDPDDSQHYIAPLKAESEEALKTLWDDIHKVVHEMKFVVVAIHEEEVEGQPTMRMHATYTSGIMGFVDDIEFHYQPFRKTIDMKSSSRVGYSDLGANRKRLESFMKKLRAHVE